ncbi:MAG: DUF4388 domain-containing protein [Chitinivibrionales bacterium]|nr:DUF4388 domain-containing protein [Chitinivibrionales bacterium]
MSASNQNKTLLSLLATAFFVVWLSAHAFAQRGVDSHSGLTSKPKATISAKMSKIRSEPKDEAKPLAFAFRGEQFIIIEDRGEWIKVDFKSQQAWIHKSECSITGADKEALEPSQKAVASTPVNYRVRITSKHAFIAPAPEKTRKPIAFALRDEHYPALAESGNWVQIKYKNTLGWIKKNDFRQSTKAKTDISRQPGMQQTAKAAVEEPTRIDSMSSAENDRNAPPVSQTAAVTRSQSDKGLKQKPSTTDRKFTSRISKVFSNPFKSPQKPEKRDLGFVTIGNDMPIIQYLGRGAKILGRADSSRKYRLREITAGWYQVEFNDTTGWIERRYANTWQPSASQPAQDDSTLAQMMAYARKEVGLSAAFGLLLTALIIVVLLSLRKKPGLPSQPAPFAGTRKCLIIAKQTKRIKSMLLGKKISLEKCIADLGFLPLKVGNLIGARNILLQSLPSIIIVDWNHSSGIHEFISNILSDRKIRAKSSVIFYNLKDISAAKTLKILPNTWYFDKDICDKDIYTVVAPRFAKGKVIQTISYSDESHALAGDISSGTLCDILQLIEIGSKTGCLLIERDELLGTIYFQDGNIVSAKTKYCNGKAAVYEILNLVQGQFHFINGKKAPKADFVYPTVGILMQWAQKNDEATIQA